MVANTCRVCGHDGPAQSKFCGECGTAFQVVCRFCEHSNPAGSQFCNQCGGQMNLLPCPRCGAVSAVTATSCYQCDSEFSGAGSEALEFPPSTNDKLALPSGQRSDMAEEEAAFAEIKRFYDRELPHGTDDSGASSHSGNFRPRLQEEATDKLAGFSEMAQPDDQLPPREADDGVRPPPATPPIGVTSRQFFRTLVATVILGVIAAVGYFEYHGGIRGDEVERPTENGESSGHDASVGMGNVSRKVADLKTLPSQNVKGATAGEKAIPGPEMIAPASASLVPESRESTKPLAFHHGDAAPEPTDELVWGKTATTPDSLVPGIPKFTVAPALELQGVATVQKAIPAADKTADALAQPAPEMPELESAPQRAARSVGVTPLQPTLAKPAEISARPAPSTSETATAPAHNPVHATAAESSQPASTKIPAAITYPVRPTPELAPSPLASPENARQSGPQACQGSYYAAIWTNCVGEVTLSDGTHYVGEFKDGLYHGRGTATLPDGETYTGELKNGKRDGQGTATYPDGRKYVGDWKNDNAHGQGTATYPGGRKYVGDFKRGRRDGKGSAIYPDGRKYVGEWRNDAYNGQGTADNPDGFRYIGEFRNGVYHGQGIAMYPSGFKYVGEFRNGRYHGQGTATSPDSSVYVGEFRDGHYDGQGTVTYPDGFRYVGEWKNDKANGKGTAFFPDGRKYVGEWTDDKPNGRGTEYRYDGLILRSGMWANGKFVKG